MKDGEGVIVRETEQLSAFIIPRLRVAAGGGFERNKSTNKNNTLHINTYGKI